MKNENEPGENKKAGYLSRFSGLVKGRFKKKLLDKKKKVFLNTSLENVLHTGFDLKKNELTNAKKELFIITVAYNNPNVIKYQAALMDKYLLDPHTHIIADNSSDEEKSKLIKEIAENYKRAYVKLPLNVFSSGSDSHSLALNWCVKQLIARFKPAYFGFLDHDIYPVKKENIIPVLEKQKIYGLLQSRDKDTWYLWPGLCFFSTANVDIDKLDFSPGTVNGVNVDTGGKLHEQIYSSLDKKNMIFPDQSYQNIREGNVFQSDKVEFIGNWMHSFNGSYWMKVKDKEKELEEVINSYLK